MSDWLGFSLSPHLRINDHGPAFGQQHPIDHATADSSSPIPIHPSFHSSPSPSHVGWRFENDDDGGGRGGPKLEDFLGGGCYSTAKDDEGGDGGDGGGGGINVNISSSSHYQEYGHTDDDIMDSRDAADCYFSTPPPQPPPPTPCLFYYGYPYYTTTTTSATTNQNPQQSYLIPTTNGVVSYDGAITPPELKSWLRPSSIPPPQPSSSSPDCDDHHVNDNSQECLSLAVAPTNSTVSMPPAVDNRKRASSNKSSKGVGNGISGKSAESFGQRTSRYRGVTRHRWTGRYEAHLWDNSCRKEGQTRKGRQVYLGGYDKEEKAARAYDLAALKYWGPTTHINFPLATYEKELEEMKNMSRQEFVANLRRKSSGFSRGASIYRGVTRHHQHGRWQARIGRVAGNKDLYLGTFSSQEEAAEAYDIAAIKFRGTSAVTNFDISRYDVTRICSSSTLIAGELAKRSSRETAVPAMVEEHLLGITNGETCDDFAEMVWGGNQVQPMGLEERQQSASNIDNGSPGQQDCTSPGNNKLAEDVDRGSDYTGRRLSSGNENGGGEDLIW